MKNRHGIVCAVYVLLLKDDKVLLLRRANTGYEDGNYSVPAGHVGGKEFLPDALIREAKEEIGVDVRKEDVEMAHIMHRKEMDRNDERLDFFFICDKWDGEIKNMEPHKCDDLSWFSTNQLPDNIIPYIKKGIENVKDKVIYSNFV